jgi:LysM repeat protein
MRKPLIPLLAAASMALVSPGSASASFVHTVLPGESLSSIAAADGLSVAQLAAANGLSPNAQLIVGSTVMIPPPGAPTPTPSPTVAAGDGDNDADDSGAGSATPTTSALSAAAPATAGSYVVQPGDTLSAIAARDGTTVDALAAANGLDPGGVLLTGATLALPSPSASAPPPAQAPPVGSTVVGRMTWFGGPNDPSAQGTPASGLGWLSNGMAYDNEGSLGNRWLIQFPWGQTLPMTQIDIGPAPWTGNPFDIAYSALPSTPYNESTWPNPVVTGTYEGP